MRRECNSALGIFPKQGQEKEKQNKTNKQQKHKILHKQKNKSSSGLLLLGGLGFTVTKA